MGNVFTASEIVEISIQIEKNGRDFYNILATKAKNEDAKSIFMYLANEEEKHIGVFQKILASVQKYEPQETYPGEYFKYMSALAKGYIFTQDNTGREIAKRVEDATKALDMGIGFEKDSIIFYEGMKKVVPEYDHKIVDELITQEKEHLLKLYKLKKL